MADKRDRSTGDHTSAQSKTPSLADLIAQTPGAQTREQALEHIAAREQSFATTKPRKSPPSEEQLSKPEPLPFIKNPEQFAAGFLERLKPKEPAKIKPPKGSKPRLLIDNDKPEPSDKK